MRRLSVAGFELAAAFLVWTGMTHEARASGLITVGSFDGSNGNSPASGVTIDAAGNLYGTTMTGGTDNRGTVWEICSGSDTITALASFTFSDGLVSPANVALDASGNLYGTASNGSPNANGTVWELAKGSGTITTLATFDGSVGSGSTPSGGATVDAAGNLYGTTEYGGSSSYGTVWELPKEDAAPITLASFGISSGANSVSPVTLDHAGNLFGTAANGGANNGGTVWELAKGSGTIMTLASFSVANGAHPQAGVTIDAAGNLYGTTAYGGATGNGTVWEIAKGSGTITTLVSFNGSNGANPFSGVAIDAKGDLFGATLAGGGSYNAGTLWEIAKGSDKLTTLMSFTAPIGTGPFSSVTIGAAGNLFGTTTEGPALANSPGYGSVYSYTSENSVPEPSSLLVYLVGLAGATIAWRRRRGEARRRCQP